MNQYATPSDYSIPNPWGPRIHNWKGGVLNEGSLYHGPIYTRPSYNLPWMPRPLNGLEGNAAGVPLMIAAVAGVGLVAWLVFRK